MTTTASSFASRPPRARGLKLTKHDDDRFELRKLFRSRPPRARGLKHFCIARRASWLLVAPPAGAWIETLYVRQAHQALQVAPPAGAWIETFIVIHSSPTRMWSRPPRARGLKRHYQACNLRIILSRPPRARGLKRALLLSKRAIQ